MTPAAGGAGVRSPLGSWRGLLGNFSALAAGETAARLLGAVATIVMARQLSPVGFGLVVLGVTLVNWFRLIVDAGTEVISVRDIARRPDRFRQIAQPILGLRLSLSVVAAALLIAVASIAVEDTSDRHVLWLFALILPMIGLNLRWMVVGVQSAKAVAIGNIASQLLLVAGVVMLIRDRHDALAAPLLMAGGELLYGAVVIAAVRGRFGIPWPRIDLPSWRSTLVDSAPMMANYGARAVLYSFDLLLISVVLGRVEAGLYGAAYKPIHFAAGLLGLLATSFLASYSAATPGAAREVARRTALSAGAVSLVFAAAVSASAALLVPLFFGDAYADAATALAILAWTAPVMALMIPYGSTLIAANRQRVLMRNNVVAAALNVVANVAVIPTLGINGAAATTVASMLLVLVLNYRATVALGLAPRLSTLLIVRRSKPAMEVQP